MRGNRIRRILAVALTAALVLGIAALTATAQNHDPTVIFDAAAGTFTFENVEKYSDATGERTYFDLFPNLKNLMPGDQVTQTIAVKVTNAGTSTVKLTLGCDDTVGLDALTAATQDHPAALTVSQGETSYTASLTSDGSDAVYLGGYTSATPEKELSVTLSIPKEAGNALQGITAQLGWVFTAEVIPSQPSGGTVQLNRVDHFAYIIGKKDGLIHPEMEITRGEVATIFFRMLTDASRSQYWSTRNPYVDVTSATWCNHAISTLSNAGVLQGYADGSFRPDAAITRGEFAAMAVRFFQVAYTGADQFTDITGHWARNYINQAAAAGIIKGYSDGTFRPEKQITRAEAITIINRVLKRTPDREHLLDGMITWPDNVNTYAWYYADVQEATNSHEFTNVAATGAHAAYERWTKLLPIRDWAAFEQEWATQNAAQNPGEVISSSTATVR